MNDLRREHTMVLYPYGTVYIRGVLGSKCAGQHNLKTVDIKEIRQTS
jgi:hypothetical protein